jgi:hypothetical protein
MKNLSTVPAQEHHIEDLFMLAITQKNTSTRIFMQLFDEERVNTSHIPTIVQRLKKHLPNVLLTECFNEDGLPFHIEVKNTEIGHLFEHVLLEYLCQLKINKGFAEATFSGRTRWNWEKDPMGTFHIRLNCGTKDADILPLAIEKTITLMKKVLLDEETVDLESLTTLQTPSGLKNGLGHENK